MHEGSNCWDNNNNYIESMKLPPEKRRSWTDSLNDEWKAYTIYNTDTQEIIATFYREDLAFEFVKVLNESLSIPAWWTPDVGAGLRREGQ